MTIGLVMVAATSVAFVANGVPLLRHDWFPIVPDVRFAINNVTGWDPTGLGSVVGYPASFLLIFLRSSVAGAIGSYATHLIFFFGYALLAVFGAARLAGILGGTRVACVAAALFAAFNPWAYTQLVAGHGFMLLSYAAMYWVVAECYAEIRSPRRLVPVALMIAPQVQFLLVAFFTYAWLSLRMRSWLTILAIGSMLLPVIVGIATSRSTLLGIPLTLEWELSQSIEPLRAVILRGYFTNYDLILPAFYEWALWGVVAIACLGVVSIVQRRRHMTSLIALTAIPLIWSFGLKGPLHGLFAWTILNFAEAGLFRELYDLLGFVAIGYAALCAVATVHWRRLDVAWLIAGCAMLAGWIIAPPQRYWVPSQMLTVTKISNSPNSRFALLPALYPARLGKRGSGTDPDLYARTSNIAPVNEALPMYPLSPAIGRYLRDRDTRPLGALSVEHLIARPWLQTDSSISYQLALPVPSWALTTHESGGAIADVTPELSLGSLPQIGTLESNVGAGNVLFGDAREAKGFLVSQAWRQFEPVIPVTTSGIFVKAAEGWVDARLAFVEEPELAQTYGGALTTNSTAILSVRPNMYALVLVRGRLSASNGALISSTTGGYRWVFVPRDARKLRCSGLCVVAAQTQRVPTAPLDPPPHRSQGVPFVTPIPWLVRATLPVGPSQLLRYNVTFDRKWSAIYGGTPLAHVRVDGVVNGWFVPLRYAPTGVIIVEWGAALVTFSEVVASVVAVFLVLFCVSQAFHDFRALHPSAPSVRFAKRRDR